MSARKSVVHISLCALCLLLARGAAFGQTPARLLKWIPADANAVAVIDAATLFHTPLAVRENWRKRAADRFANHEINVPPEARRLVSASQLNLGAGLQPMWELGIVELDRTPSFALIARRESGQLDTIAGHSAVRLPSGRTGVELEPGILLGTAHPNRQTIARWVGTPNKDGTPRLSPFLRKAVSQPDRKSQVLLALDLVDSVTADSLRGLLANFELLQDKPADQADFAEILASVQGVVLEVEVTDKREGTIRVEFSRPTTIIKPAAKPLMEEILKTLEISLADFEHWSAETAGNAIVLKGEFSPGDLRLVASLFASSPSASHLREPEATPTTVDPAAAKADASLKYFHSVKGLVEELRKTLSKTRDNHVVWMERFARKIDDLPLLDVDKDLLTFGGNVSSSLRYQAQAGRMGALRAGVREAQPVYQTWNTGAVGPYGSYGGYSFSVRVSPDRGQIRTEEHANAAQVRVSEMKQIEDGMVQIRRAMTERYKIEF